MHYKSLQQRCDWSFIVSCQSITCTSHTLSLGPTSTLLSSTPPTVTSFHHVHFCISLSITLSLFHFRLKKSYLFLKSLSSQTALVHLQSDFYTDIFGCYEMHLIPGGPIHRCTIWKQGAKAFFAAVAAFFGQQPATKK